MKGLAITSQGMEDIVSLEIKGLIGQEGESKESCVIFDIKKPQELCLLCYKAQSVEKILYLLDYFDFKDKEGLYKNLKKVMGKIKFDQWLDKTSNFRVTCKKNNDFLSSEEIASHIGALIIEEIKRKKKYRQKVELDNPDITFLIFINKNTAYFGIDFSGRDLHKREYKLFAHKDSLRATVAYALVRIADLKPKETLLDPFCHSGEIAIEGALFITNFPVNYFSKEKFSFLKFKPLKKANLNKLFQDADKKIVQTKKPKILCLSSAMMDINASKKNAKIAGINKALSFSRMDTEWLDTKLDKESIDKIVTHPPELSRTTNQKDIEKIYNEFFHQAEFILKKKGLIVIVSRNSQLLKTEAEKYKFKIEEEMQVFSGKQPYTISIFSKKL
jgi:23S rRNA G2445 N2-methylase RlmL